LERPHDESGFLPQLARGCLDRGFAGIDSAGWNLIVGAEQVSALLDEDDVARVGGRNEENALPGFCRSHAF